MLVRTQENTLLKYYLNLNCMTRLPLGPQALVVRKSVLRLGLCVFFLPDHTLGYRIQDEASNLDEDERLSQLGQWSSSDELLLKTLLSIAIFHNLVRHEPVIFIDVILHYILCNCTRISGHVDTTFILLTSNNESSYNCIIKQITESKEERTNINITIISTQRQNTIDE